MTGRAIDAVQSDAIKRTPIRPLYFFYGNFQSEPLYVNSSSANVIWDGKTWLGVGRLGAIQAVKEGVELKAYSLGLKLSGVPVELVGKAVGDRYQGRSGIVYLCPLDSDYGLIGTPKALFKGRMDTMQVKFAGKMAEITLTLQNRMADWARPRIRRLTNEAQQFRFSGDKGLEFVPQMAEKNIIWGRG